MTIAPPEHGRAADGLCASDARVPSPWTAVCRRDQLEPLWGEAALIGTADGDVQLAVFLLPDGRLFAVSNADPATGAFVMSRGMVGEKRLEGRVRPTIASPLHKDVFDLETGHCYTKPALRLPSWRARVTDDGVVEVAPRPALVAASHGTSDHAGRRAVAGLVAAVRARHPELAVLDSFVDVQQPDVPATTGALAAGLPAVVVPLLLSAGYHVHVDLAEAAAAGADEETPREIRVSPALGPDIRLAHVLARRLREAGLRDDDRVVLAAAGSSDAGAVADCHRTGELLQTVLGRPVTVSFISAAAPRVADAVAALRADGSARVVVATYLLAPGYFATLASEAGADVTSAPLLVDGEDAPVELVDIVAELYGGVTAGG